MTTPAARRRLLLVLLAVAILAAVATLYVWHGRKAAETTLYGNIDIREVTLGFRVGGRVGTLLVDEGDTVREGQVLARLDATPLELELGEARASAGAIGARLALLRAGFRAEDVEQAAAVVAERRAASTNAEQALARQEELRGTGAVAPRLYDDAVAARDQARARLKAAEQSYAQLKGGYRRQEVAEAEANQTRAGALVAQAEQRLADAALHAPGDGIVLTRAVEPGAIVAPGTPVLTVSLVKPVWARIYINEPDLAQVAPGRRVLVYTDAPAGRAYHGQVGFVSPTAEFTPKNVETPELRTALVYRARVVVTDSDAGLRQGMPVTVKLTTER